MNYLSLLRRVVVTFAIAAVVVATITTTVVTTVAATVARFLTLMSIYLRIDSVLFVTIQYHLCGGSPSHVDQWFSR